MDSNGINDLFLSNHWAVGVEFIETYINKKGVLCLKGANKTKAKEFDREVDRINEYFTFLITNKTMIDQVSSFKNGDKLHIYAHLSKDSTIRANGGVSYADGIYADSILLLETA